jgi:hypothetical protein
VFIAFLDTLVDPAGKFKMTTAQLVTFMEGGVAAACGKPVFIAFLDTLIDPAGKFKMTTAQLVKFMDGSLAAKVCKTEEGVVASLLENIASLTRDFEEGGVNNLPALVKDGVASRLGRDLIEVLGEYLDLVRGTFPDDPKTKSQMMKVVLGASPYTKSLRPIVDRIKALDTTGERAAFFRTMPGKPQKRTANLKVWFPWFPAIYPVQQVGGGKRKISEVEC